MKPPEFLRAVRQLKDDMRRQANSWDALVAQGVIELLQKSDTVERGELIAWLEALRDPKNEDWFDRAISVALNQVGK